MSRYKTQRIAPILLAIVIIIVAVAGLVALGRLLFSGVTRSNTSVTQSESIISTTRDDLLKTTDGRAISMTVRGPIVADEDFRSYRITISPSSRNFEAFTGYLESSTSNQSLSNNTAAYNQFVNALDKARLVNSAPTDSETADLLGICATGKVYEFNILNNGSSTALYWTSTCSGSRGNLSANIGQVSSLFFSQIPDGSDIESNLSL